MNTASTCSFLPSIASDEIMENVVPSSSAIWWNMRDAQFSENSLSEWSNPTQTPGSTSITCSSISDNIEGQEWPPAPYNITAGSVSSEADVNGHFKEMTVNFGQEKFSKNCSEVVESVDYIAAGVNFGSGGENMSWTSGLALLGVGGPDALQYVESSPLEGFNLHDPYNSIKVQNTSYDPAERSHNIKYSDSLSHSCDFSLKNLVREEISEILMNIKTEDSHTCTLESFDQHQPGRLMEIANMEAWSAPMDQSKNTQIRTDLSCEEFSFSNTNLDLTNRPRPKELIKPKQEPDIYLNYSSDLGISSSSAPQMLGSSDASSYGGCRTVAGSAIAQILRPELISGEIINSCYPVNGHGDLYPPKRWMTKSYEFPTTFSQLLPASSFKQEYAHCASVGHGRTYQLADYIKASADRLAQQSINKHSNHSCNSEPSLVQRSQREIKSESYTTSTSLARKKLMQAGQNMDESRQQQLDSTRLAGACSSMSTSELGSCQSYFKRQRLEQNSLSLLKSVHPRKEKASERIAELQQLVSPYGKTDQASVLGEVINHIQKLHRDIQQYCTIYLKNNAAAATLAQCQLETITAGNSWSSDKLIMKDEETGKDLRSRGLCLVPLSCCTLQVAGDGAHGPPELWMHLAGSR